MLAIANVSATNLQPSHSHGSSLRPQQITEIDFMNRSRILCALHARLCAAFALRRASRFAALRARHSEHRLTRLF